MTLEKGMKLAKYLNGTFTCAIVEIERVTKTTAISGSIKFKREQNDIVIKRMGLVGFDGMSYRVAGERDIYISKKREIVEDIQPTRWMSLSLAQLQSILNIINEKV